MASRTQGGNRRKKGEKVCGVPIVVAWDDAQDNGGRLLDVEKERGSSDARAVSK